MLTQITSEALWPQAGLEEFVHFLLLFLTPTLQEQRAEGTSTTGCCLLAAHLAGAGKM